MHTKTCRLIFLTALFITAKDWNKFKCPSISEWMNKLIYQYISAIFQNITRQKKGTNTIIWMTLQCIMFNERSQTQKGTFHVTLKGTYILYDSTSVTFWKRLNIKVRKQISSCLGLELERRLTYKGYRKL